MSGRQRLIAELSGLVLLDGDCELGTNGFHTLFLLPLVFRSDYVFRMLFVLSVASVLSACLRQRRPELMYT